MQTFHAPSIGEQPSTTPLAGIGALRPPTARKQLTSFVVIPARLASTRLARKLLLRETGRSLLQHTYQAAQQAKTPVGIRVAVDDAELLAEVESFGGKGEMTSRDCASGTDRVAEVARRLPQADILVNVQGDEPELPGQAIDAAIDVLQRNPQTVMSTLATPIRSKEQLFDPACVKVVFDNGGHAQYFSRSPIPAVRDWDDRLLVLDPPCFYQHIGLYAYRRDFLLAIAALPQTNKERLEKLEQLRVLDAGHSIAVAVIPHATVGIDTPADYAAFVARWRARHSTR